MKKVLVMLALVVSLVACGGGATPTANTNGVSTTGASSGQGR